MTITDFLLARIAEDMVWAQEHERQGDFQAFDEDVCARVLAECEAKRRIVAAAPKGTCNEAHPTMDVYHPDGHASPILQALALPYADHPDYHDTWAV